MPLILIGHTFTMAWSHTVSTAFRFTPIQLTLVPGDPTAYLFDGKVVQIVRERCQPSHEAGDAPSAQPQTSHG